MLKRIGSKKIIFTAALAAGTLAMGINAPLAAIIYAINILYFSFGDIILSSRI